MPARSRTGHQVRTLSAERPYRLAFSQSGFVTLKGEMSVAPWSRAIPQSPWIRTSGHAHASFQASTGKNSSHKFLDSYLPLDWQHLHVWQRDFGLPGLERFEPGSNPLVQTVEEMIRQKLLEKGDPRSDAVGKICVDRQPSARCDLVEPNRWWVGATSAKRSSIPARGRFSRDKPDSMISRAYSRQPRPLHGPAFRWRKGTRWSSRSKFPGRSLPKIARTGIPGHRR